MKDSERDRERERQKEAEGKIVLGRRLAMAALVLEFVILEKSVFFVVIY